MTLKKSSFFPIRRFRKNEDGATAVEYAMILGLFAAGIVVWGTRTGNDVSTSMSEVAVTMDNTADSAAGVVRQGGD